MWQTCLLVLFAVEAPATSRICRRGSERGDSPHRRSTTQRVGDLWHRRGKRPGMTNTIDALAASISRDDVPDFRPGDTLKVHVKLSLIHI